MTWIYCFNENFIDRQIEAEAKAEGDEVVLRVLNTKATPVTELTLDRSAAKDLVTALQGALQGGVEHAPECERGIHRCECGAVQLPIVIRNPSVGDVELLANREFEDVGDLLRWLLVPEGNGPSQPREATS